MPAWHVHAAPPPCEVCEYQWTPWFQPPGLNGDVYDVQVFDDGNGPAVYVGGAFSTAGGETAGRLAKWDGRSWSGLLDPAAFAGPIRAMAVADVGNGPILFYADPRTTLDGPVVRIVSFDGTTHTTIGTVTGTVPAVWTMATFNTGSGEKLFVGGALEGLTVGSPHGTAIWDGLAWSVGPHPFGVRAFVEFQGIRHAASVMPWPVFPRLLEDSVDGRATIITPRLRDGGSLLPCCSDPNPCACNTESLFNGEIRAMTVFDDGTGEALYVAGDFTTVDFPYVRHDLLAPVVSVNHVAKWDGTTWSPLLHDGNPNDNGTAGPVNALAVFDDGAGADPQRRPLEQKSKTALASVGLIVALTLERLNHRWYQTGR